MSNTELRSWIVLATNGLESQFWTVDDQPTARAALEAVEPDAEAFEYAWAYPIDPNVPCEEFTSRVKAVWT